MKISLRIARTELASLFFSPIAWFILIVFSFLSAKHFCALIESNISFHSVQGTGGSSLTATLFMTSWGSVWTDVVSNLYIYIPLLTMGLISRETASGSIKLLYSSPIDSWQIVIGKFLAAAAFGACMLVVPILTMFSSALLIPAFDWMPVLVGLLGVYLLVCVYCAVGLFMSSLTSYQVVAAIGTLAALAALRFVGQIGQEYEFIRELTYWLSLNGRTSQFLVGVVRSEDVVYFVAVIAMFLAFTTLRISFGRRSVGRAARAAAYVGVVAATLAVGYATSRPQTVAVWDATRNKSNSLTADSRALLRSIEGPLTITHYVNLFDRNASPYLPRHIKQNDELFAPYRLAKPDLRVRYVYYYDQTPNNSWISRPQFAAMSLDELRNYVVLVLDVNPYLFLSPERIRSMVDLSSEQNSFVRLVETADGRRAWLRDFSDPQRTPGEAEISAVLKKMTSVPPTVAFVKVAGTREVARPGDRDYGAFSIEKQSRTALINQGFEVLQIDLDAGESIPDEVNIVVLADPRKALSAQALDVLNGYIDRGGSMFLLTDTGQQTTLAPLLARFGVRASEGQLVQLSEDFAPDFILAEGAASAEVPRHFADGRLRVTMPGCVALDTLADGRGFRRTVWLQSPSTGSWNELESRSVRDDMTLACNPAAGEEERSHAVLVAAERMVGARAQRILIAGDADCMSNAELRIGREGFRSGNAELVKACFRYLSGGEFPIDVRRQGPIDTRYRPDAASLAGVIRILLLIVLPLLLIGLGAGIRLVRGKK